MSRRVYVYFLLTFILGIIAGGAGVYFQARHFGLGPRLGPGTFDPQHIVNRMTKDLQLTPDQAQKIKALLDDYFNKHRELDRQHEPEYDALRQQSRAQVRAILTPDQLVKFNEHVRRVDERVAHDRAAGK